MCSARVGIKMIDALALLSLVEEIAYVECAGHDEIEQLEIRLC